MGRVPAMTAHDVLCPRASVACPWDPPHADCNCLCECSLIIRVRNDQRERDGA